MGDVDVDVDGDADGEGDVEGEGEEEEEGEGSMSFGAVRFPFGDSRTPVRGLFGAVRGPFGWAVPNLPLRAAALLLPAADW